jgi:hypothetical protein
MIWKARRKQMMGVAEGTSSQYECLDDLLNAC